MDYVELCVDGHAAYPACRVTPEIVSGLRTYLAFLGFQIGCLAGKVITQKEKKLAILLHTQLGDKPTIMER
jgi:hypothetical protein